MLTNVSLSLALCCPPQETVSSWPHLALCISQRCRRKMLCPPTAASQSTSTVERLARAMEPGSPLWVGNNSPFLLVLAAKIQPKSELLSFIFPEDVLIFILLCQIICESLSSCWVRVQGLLQLLNMNSEDIKMVWERNGWVVLGGNRKERLSSAGLPSCIYHLQYVSTIYSVDNLNSLIRFHWQVLLACYSALLQCRESESI